MATEVPRYAKLASPICHAPGLFSSLPKRQESKLVRLTYEAGGLIFRFIGPQLRVTELRVLQGLLGLAAQQNRCTSDARQPCDGARSRVDALLADSARVNTTLNELARAIGYPTNSGSAHATIRSSLELLFAVSVFVGVAESPASKDVSAGHLLSRLKSAKEGSTLEIELSRLLAFAVLGGPGQYLRLDLAEVRKLKTDAARLLHHRLLWINAGQRREVGLDTLCSYVWSAPQDGVTQRKRRERVRAALLELEGIGWTVIKLRPTVYSIIRPRPDISVTSTLP